MDLFKASNQWASRPPDQRFWTVEEMGQKCRDYAESSRTATVINADIRVEADGSELNLMGKAEIPARVSHHAFGQLAGRADAPAGYLRTLPATLAAQNINHGLKRHAEGTSKLLLHNGDGYLCRALTSEIYERVWNYELCQWLEPILEEGWRTAPARAPYQDATLAAEGQIRPATEDDLMPGVSSVNLGEMIAPAGLYASDHDMFVFMIHPDRQIDVGENRTLCKGFFLWNAETGGVSLGGMTFLFDHVCGNHIVWGAEDVKEFRLRHVGRIRGRAIRRLRVDLRKYADESVSELEGKIVYSKSFELGADKANVVLNIFKRNIGATKRQLEEAYQIAETQPDTGNPRSAWGMAQGLTRLSQKSGYTDERVKLDRAAGKVMEMAF